MHCKMRGVRFERTPHNDHALRWMQVWERLDNLGRQLDWLDASLQREFPAATRVASVITSVALADSR